MCPAVAAVIAICCGPGVNNCGCGKTSAQAQAPSYQWGQTGPGEWALTGTKVTIDYAPVTDNFEVKWSNVTHIMPTLIEAEIDGDNLAIKLLSYGMVP